MHVVHYNEAGLHEYELDTKQSFPQSSTEAKIEWYDIRGLHDTDFIKYAGEKFDLHPLILEDAVDTNQRPKQEEYEDGHFVILKALHFDPSQKSVVTEQVALFFRENLLISFQESETDLFHSVRNRLSLGQGRVRSRGADYLAYTLIDAIVDHYFTVIDDFDEVISSIEVRILEAPTSKNRAEIHHLRKQMLVIKKCIGPLREALNTLYKSESNLIHDQTQPFLRDAHDHSIQILDMVDTHRDLLNGMQDLYISEISFKMNQVMQVLAVVTTLFVPLSFLAGIYGMNFDRMPELHAHNGYYILLSVMAFIFISSICYFRWKKWF